MSLSALPPPPPRNFLHGLSRRTIASLIVGFLVAIFVIASAAALYTPNCGSCGNDHRLSAVMSPLVGSWSIYSSAFYYDAGGGAPGYSPSFQQIALHTDGTWQFGSSIGSWSVSNITQSDWSSWNVSSYGPTEKLVLSGWGNASGLADGPIETSSSGTVDFFWIIYHVSSPAVIDPGTAWLKFGHAQS